MEQRVTSILPTMTDESRPDLIISSLIAHLQTPLKILEHIYIDGADKYNKHFTQTVMRCESSGSVQSESPGGANLPSLPSAHT